MKSILALTALLAASAANLAFVHDSAAATLSVFVRTADGAEMEISRQPNLGMAECMLKAGDIWSAAHAADVAALDASCDLQTAQPRLVGYGCAGATAPLYANAEDDFPACDRIEETH